MSKIVEKAVYSTFRKYLETEVLTIFIHLLVE
jgi:hypothetical protein